jgi:hypothetical protein
MEPPVAFSVSSVPFHSQELLARARQYRAVALTLVDIDNGRPNWPKYTLLFQAIELVLKAAIVSFGERSVPKPAGPEPGNHDLSALYDYAIAYGLIQRHQIIDDLPSRASPARLAAREALMYGQTSRRPRWESHEIRR